MVLAVNGQRGGLVTACSSAAVAQGVHPNMPLAEAQALAPPLAIAPHDPAADRCALEKLAEACEQFTPCVALEEGDEPESLLLDITNLEHLHGSEHQLPARVKNFFTRRGYRVRIAVAETIGLAWALAHFGGKEDQLTSPNDEIRMTNDKTAHSSFVIRHSSFTSCQDLPLASLRIPADTVALLRELGIQTISQLQSLPRDDLAQRFGDELLRRLDQFTGTAPEAIQPHRAVAELEVTCVLEEPTADRAVLMHVLSQLIQQLCRRLIARDQGAVLLLCILHSPSGTTIRGGTPRVLDGRGENASQTTPFTKPQGVPLTSLRIGLVEPSANPRQLLELIELHLETLSLAGEVDRVQIRAAVVGRLGERQGELFADRWPSDPHQLALLINRLSSRLGHEQVLRAELRSSPVPERAVRWATMTAESRAKSRESRAKRFRISDCGLRIKEPQSAIPGTPWVPQSAIPLLLHPQPQPIEVVCVAPDGPPHFVWLENHREQIMHHVGPERIETLWWRGPTIRRDYDRIATESGSHLWIFRQLTNARWFIHGVFE